MHRVGRDGPWFLDKYRREFSPDDRIVLIFGEIDVRCHLVRIAEKERRSLEDVAASLGTRYVEAVRSKAGGIDVADVVVCSVPPPAENSARANEQYPFVGSWRQRVHLHKVLNETLLRECHGSDILFLDFAGRFATEEGVLNKDLSDGSVHINPQHAGPIIEDLGRLLNVPLGILPVPVDQARYLAGTEPTSLVERIRSSLKRKADRIAAFYSRL